MLNENEAKVRQVLIDLQNKVRPEEAMKALSELQANEMIRFLEIVPLTAIIAISKIKPDGIDVLQGAYVSGIRQKTTVPLEQIINILVATNQLQFPEEWPEHNISKESLAHSAMDALWRATWSDEYLIQMDRRNKVA